MLRVWNTIEHYGRGRGTHRAEVRPVVGTILVSLNDILQVGGVRTAGRSVPKPIEHIIGIN